MRFIANDIFEFTPPGGEAGAKISVAGGQDYSPGQARKNDIWLLRVPADYVDIISDGTELGSYGEVLAVLAACFCDGDEARAQSQLVRVPMGGT